ncbi:MAG: hypothetical protein DHS20C15_04310 [Planctomycetota bacterium]|nr:MAG: hypothetical protein DHS20C15_04310 [Planctomycetota bacterium]
MVSRAVLCLGVLMTGLLPALRADVLRVDAGGGGDFRDLPAAVAAAADGDILLLASGNYSGATLDDLGVSLIGDGPNVKLNGHLVIQNLAAGKRVALSRVRVEAPVDPDIFETTPPSLHVIDCDGAVRIERSQIFGASHAPNSGDCIGFSGWPSGAVGLWVESSADVVLEGCSVTGGLGVEDGGFSGCLDHGSWGGTGVYVHDSRVDLHEVIATGADGGPQGYGGVGGAGLWVAGSSDVLASGVVAQGGQGGDSDDFLFSFMASYGGDGLRSEAGSLVRFVGGSFFAGDPGFACCWTPDPGVAQDLQGASVIYPGSPHRFLTTSPAREGESLTLSITGSVGDTALLFAGFGTLALHKPGLGGAIYVAAPFVFGPAPILPLGNGITNFELPVPELGPSFDAVLLDMQLFVQEGGGAKHLTGPAQVVLLDASF